MRLKRLSALTLGAMLAIIGFAVTGPSAGGPGVAHAKQESHVGWITAPFSLVPGNELCATIFNAGSQPFAYAGVYRGITSNLDIWEFSGQVQPAQTALHTFDVPSVNPPDERVILLVQIQGQGDLARDPRIATKMLCNNEYLPELGLTAGPVDPAEGGLTVVRSAPSTFTVEAGQTLQAVIYNYANQPVLLGGCFLEQGANWNFCNGWPAASVGPGVGLEGVSFEVPDVPGSQFQEVSGLNVAVGNPGKAGRQVVSVEIFDENMNLIRTIAYR